MVGMIASRPMGGIRGKDRANGLRKSKERGSRLNGPTQPTSPWEERRITKKET